MIKAVFAVLLLVGACAAQNTDYENSVCECVPYFQCTAQGSANEDGEGIIDIRVGTNDSPTA